jgi:hypothetical protein
MSLLSLTTNGIELFDDPAADPVLVERSLRNIARSNRWFGGHAAVRYGLAGLVGRRGGPADRPPSRPLTLLDVGTGLGDIPLVVRRWGEARGIRVAPLGLDLHPRAARLALEQGIPALVGDAGALPVKDRGVDLVIVSQLAHHLDDASCVALFRECGRVARVGVIVADLFRSRLAAAGFWLGSTLLGFDHCTRDDGIVSLRRGFTVARLKAIARAAGVAATVTRRPGSRIVAWWREPS